MNYEKYQLRENGRRSAPVTLAQTAQRPPALAISFPLTPGFRWAWLICARFINRLKQGVNANPLRLGWALATSASLALVAIFGTGCQTAEKPAGAAFASVLIDDHTANEIRDVAVEVFHDDGYKAPKATISNMLFEKEGSQVNNMTYGNWMGENVWIRVRAAVVPISEKTCRLQCQAYMVRDKGGASEEEVKLGHFHRKAFQKLLDEAGARLNGTWNSKAKSGAKSKS